MLLEISVDDGCWYDFRSLGLLERYGLLKYSTFYIALRHQKALTTEEIKIIGDMVEVGGHTFSHALLTRLDEKERMFQLSEGRRILQDITGQEVLRFCYPKGWHNQDVEKSVEKAGFNIGRTMKLGIKTLEGYSPYRRPVTAHIYPRPEYNGDIVQGAINLMGGDYFGLVFHSWEVERFNLWKELEAVLKYIYENKSSELE